MMLTRVLRDGLDFIERFQAIHGGVSPTVRQLGAGLGMRSVSGSQRILEELERRGYIRRLPNRARAIEVLRSSPIRRARYVVFRFDDVTKALVPIEPQEVSTTSLMTESDVAASRALR